jgi:putative molybdopterin biosynthesis protein
MPPPRFRNQLRELRIKSGLRQNQLAARASISRQSLGAIEAGETVPATNIALQLARALGCRVEDIFSLADTGGSLDATLIATANEPGAALAAAGRKRVALAEVGGRWLGHLLDGDGTEAPVAPADGLLEPDRARSLGSARPLQRVRPLRASEELRQNLFGAGCDPALALLGGHLRDQLAGPRLHWVQAGSTAALDLLARGEVHLAGLHLFDQDTGEFNVAAVRRRFEGRAMVVVNLAAWEQGLVVAPGNPRRIRKVGDLGRKGVRVIGRERGSGSDELFTRLTMQAGLPRKAVAVVAVARGHLAVARAIGTGGADTGIATRAAATSCGLDFLPLAEARFDLAMSAETASDPRVQRLLEVLTSPSFRRDLGGLPGYGTARTGNLIAELAA